MPGYFLPRAHAGAAELQAEGFKIAIVDALSQEDLDRLGEALQTEPFLTASSGLASSLPACRATGVLVHQAV